MKYIDPQQELFSLLLVALRHAYPGDVYDGDLPPEGTDYPFIYMGHTQQIDSQNKQGIIGRVIQTIHIWHNNPRERGTLSEIMVDIKHIARCTHKGNFYNWDLLNLNQQILSDNTTDYPLLHGVVELEFKFD